ncbi:MAG: ABC transporter permease, partial [Longimicrobiales bacterium]
MNPHWHLSVAVAIGTLRANPLHTALSTLGIIIGVGALVAILALGDGMERFARQQIETTTDLQAIAI